MKSVLLLLRLMIPFWKWVLLSILLGTATYLSGAALLGTSAYLIASAALHPSIAELQIAIVGVRFFGISRGIFRYFERLVSHSVNLRLLAAIRVWFFRALEPLSPVNLQDYRRGDLLARAITDIESLENFYIRAAAPPVVAAIVVLIFSIYIGRYDGRLAVLLAGGLLFSGLIIPIISRRMAAEPATRLSIHNAELSSALVDSVQGSAEIITNGQQSEKLKLLWTTIFQQKETQNRIARQGSLVNSANILISGLCLAAVLTLGVGQIGEQTITGVELAVIVLITISSFEAVQPLGQAAQAAQKSLASAERLFSVAAIKPEITEPSDPVRLPVRPNITINNLSFRYGLGMSPALENLDLDLSFGRHVAVVGGSGAGKTTLSNLLMRFTEFNQGTIRIDGTAIQQYSPGLVRHSMGVLTHHTYIFADTLRANLLIARPEALDYELNDAIQTAGLEDWLRSLPEGLNGWLGERGANLSAGERQRLGIARILLKNSPIMICDEPTANLDALNEQKIIRLLQSVSHRKTLLWITHRLFGLETMDEIIVLQSGKVVERGKQADLLVKGGVYARMREIQQQIIPIT